MVSQKFTNPKSERPLRPITSSIGSPTCAVSKHLVSICPLSGGTTSQLKTVQNLHKKSNKILLTATKLWSLLTSVKSLFTSIPVDLALTITRERLQQDKNLKDRTNMSVSNIMKLLDFLLNHNYFKYDDIHSRKVFGCAMGSPISPVLADLVMAEIEETAMSTAPHPPKWWFRYVDDSHTCMKRDHVNEFHFH